MRGFTASRMPRKVTLAPATLRVWQRSACPVTAEFARTGKSTSTTIHGPCRSGRARVPGRRRACEETAAWLPSQGRLGLPGRGVSPVHEGLAGLCSSRAKTLKQVQGWLRHSQLSTTLNVYIHEVDDSLGSADAWDGVIVPAWATRATEHPEAVATKTPLNTPNPQPRAKHATSRKQPQAPRRTHNPSVPGSNPGRPIRGTQKPALGGLL